MDDQLDPLKAAHDRLLKVEMQYPHALEGVASLYVWCQKTGVVGMALWKIVLFFGVIIGAWLATKQWIMDWISSGITRQ